jgi:hypothetical protein
MAFRVLTAPCQAGCITMHLINEVSLWKAPDLNGITRNSPSIQHTYYTVFPPFSNSLYESGQAGTRPLIQVAVLDGPQHHADGIR